MAGAFYSDNPFIVLDAPCVRPAQREGAQRFQEYSSSTERENQDRLAAEVRALRDEVGAVAAGMSEAYESGR